MTFIIYFSLKKDYRMVFLSVTASIIMGAIIFSHDTFIGERFSKEKIEINVEGRTSNILTGMRMFMDRPILGFGYEGWTENITKYGGRIKVSAHNHYITMLVNYGLIGFISFMGIFIYPLIFSLKIYFRRDVLTELYQKDMALLYISFMLPFMVNMYFSGGSYGEYFGICEENYNNMIKIYLTILLNFFDFLLNFLNHFF